MKSFTVGKNDAGVRLDRFIAKNVPLLPPSLAQKYIRIKRIKVAGRGAARDLRLSLGDVIELYINDEFFEKPTEENAYLRIVSPELCVVYEDENILLINKPAGMLCHSDGSAEHSTLIARVQAHLYKSGEWKPREENSFSPALCNRIDRNTQGIVIAAKNAETLRIVNERIKLRELDKRYLAVVTGPPPEKSGKLEGWLFKDSVQNRVYLTENKRRGSSFASTGYKTLAQEGGLTLLECRLHTGRTHQIRAQLAAAGCPILGDGKYGSERVNREFGEKNQLLCSYYLRFDFRSDAQLLGYLAGRIFKLDEIDFVVKYFSCTTGSIML